MRVVMIAAVALALAGCAPGGGKGQACAVKTEMDWAATPAAIYKVRATADGAACRDATIGLKIVGPDGKEAFAFQAPITDMPVIFEIYDAKSQTTPAQVEAALKQWISQDPQASTAGQLPPWNPGDDQPQLGEFPFYPEEGLTRDAYEAIRASNAPVFRFVQGGESEAVFVLEEGAFRKVGAQSFPG